MNTSGIIATVLTATAVTVGGLYGIVHVDHVQRMERNASSHCWMDKGEWKDGTCVMPEEKNPEGAVCVALGGAYMVKAEELTCFRADESVIDLPDLEGKKVEVQDDGTVLLYSGGKGK